MPVGTASWPTEECIPRSLPASASRRDCSSNLRMVTIVEYIHSMVSAFSVEWVVIDASHGLFNGVLNYPFDNLPGPYTWQERGQIYICPSDSRQSRIVVNAHP